MQIFVRTITNLVTPVDVEAEWTIGELEARLRCHDRIALPPGEQFRLVFAGRQLDDDASLGECGVSSGSTVHLVLRLRGSPTWLTAGQFSAASPPPLSPPSSSLQRLAVRRLATADWVQRLASDRRLFHHCFAVYLNDTSRRRLLHVAHVAHSYAQHAEALLAAGMTQAAAPACGNGNVVACSRYCQAADAVVLVVYQCPDRAPVYADSCWLLRLRLPAVGAVKVTVSGPLPHVNVARDVELVSHAPPASAVERVVERFERLLLLGPSHDSDLVVDRRLADAADLGGYVGQLFQLSTSDETEMKTT